MTQEELVDLFALRISLMEGFNKRGSIAQRHNNPGNLRSWGPTKIINGYAYFKSVEDGWSALKKQITRNVFVRELTFLEFFIGKPGVYGGYAPAADKNHPFTYAKFVADGFNASIGTKIKDLVS